MRTYSHAILTYAALRLLRYPEKEAALGALGATLPDLPAGVGAGWLWTKKRSATRRDFDAEVCGRSVFRLPDAAAHSFPVFLVALFAGRGSGTRRAFFTGWFGHLAVDFFTHSSDARPQFWPLSGRRFRSPISYRESNHHGRVVSYVEHALTILAVVSIVAGGLRNRRS